MNSDHADIYPYAAGPLLDARNTYSYTAYHGTAFLDAWREARERVLAAPTPDAAPCAEPPASPTARLLRRIQASLAGGDGRSAALADLNRLLQRFEVTKRVHGEYNENWRPADPEDFRELGLYLALAETLDAAYTATGVLQYLNGLLKCLDTLSAYLPVLDGPQMGRLRALVRQERAHVDALGATLGASGT